MQSRHGLTGSASEKRRCCNRSHNEESDSDGGWQAEKGRQHRAISTSLSPSSCLFGYFYREREPIQHVGRMQKLTAWASYATFDPQTKFTSEERRTACLRSNTTLNIPTYLHDQAWINPSKVSLLRGLTALGPAASWICKLHRPCHRFSRSLL